MTHELHHGDCLDVMRKMEPGSIDSCITDPPYGLSNTSPAHYVEALTEWGKGNRGFTPQSPSGFMGEEWDSFVPPPAVWDEVYRLLKPGGHALVFAGTRTMGIMETSLRFAGFDIRDSIAWIHSGGVPKSSSISKTIDKARTEDKEPTRAVAAFILDNLKSSGITQRQAEEQLGLGFNSLCNFIQPNRKSFGVPRWELWQDMKRVIGFGDEMDAEVYRLNGRKGTLGDNWQNAEVMGIRKGAMSGWNMDGTTKFVDREDKAPATAESQKWQGWGTALRPAFEPVIVARKPFKGTVAQNVVTHGTGAINVEASRSGGRWPSNVTLDEAAALSINSQVTDAARFYYCAKASKLERPAVNGVTHPTVKPLMLMSWLSNLCTQPGGTVLDPFAGSGATLEAAVASGFNTIGIEREGSYIPLIESRLARVLDTDQPLFRIGATA